MLGPVPFSVMGWFRGLGSVAPARGMWEEFVGSVFVFDIMGR